jgi:hypothetical protein
MGMAMTVLSFSMFTFYGQRAIDEWTAPASQPSPTAALVEGFSRDVSGLWKSAAEMTSSAIAFYELQTGGAEVEKAPAPAANEPEGAR